MSKPNDRPPGRGKLLGTCLIAMTGMALLAATGLLLQLPLAATAGIASGDNDRGVSQIPSPPAGSSHKASGNYQLRCWQYGRLLFDEGPVTLGAESRQGARLVAFNRQGAALIVTDAGGTTCLARPFTAAPNLPLQR